MALKRKFTLTFIGCTILPKPVFTWLFFVTRGLHFPTTVKEMEFYSIQFCILSFTVFQSDSLLLLEESVDIISTSSSFSLLCPGGSNKSHYYDLVVTYSSTCHLTAMDTVEQEHLAIFLLRVHLLVNGHSHH